MRLPLIFLAASVIGSSFAFADVNRFSGMCSPAFVRVSAESDCDGLEPLCYDEQLEFDGQIGAACYPYDCVVHGTAYYYVPDDGPPKCFVSGLAGAWIGGDTPWATQAQVRGERPSADTLEIIGEIDQAYTQENPVEVSVFRFAGDPATFTGLHVTGVSDLVDHGVITAGDVVFTMTTLGHEFEELVDVAGIPDAEIVLLIAGEGPTPSDSPWVEGVPALGPAGVVVLSGLLLAAGYAALRRRQC